MINKNLPAQVGESLKKRLYFLEDLEKKHEKLLETVESQKKLLNHAEKQASLFSNLSKQEAELEKKKILVLLDEKERNFELEIAKLTAAEALKRENLAIDLVKTIFRNTICRSTVRKQGNVPVINKWNDGTQSVRHEQVDITETTEEETI